VRVPSSSGVELELHDLAGHGSRGLPPLLVAHATGFCARAYEPLASALGASFHVWAVDFRGHGDSTPPADGDFRWAGMGDDVLAVAGALGVASLHGFGHSMGGAALLLAELARPGLLASLYVYEPIVLPASAARSGEPPLAAAARRRRAGFPSRAEALHRYATRPPLNVLRADALAAYVEHGFADTGAGGVRLKCQPEHEGATFAAEPKLTIEEVAAAGLAVPSAVVGRGAAEASGPAAGPAALAPLVASAIPGARLVEYPHLGHFGPLQAPEQVAADVATAALAG
jgi:pimeloyl-ACP methyl ester carboxylesterase